MPRGSSLRLPSNIVFLLIFPSSHYLLPSFRFPTSFSPNIFSLIFFHPPLLSPLLTPQIPNPLTIDDVSFEPQVDESERLRCLSAAITCAVLAPAGPQRSRILATLYKDERASQYLPTDFAILEKMHFLRLLR